VDPDNRRPVDFAARRALLAELTGRGEANLPELAAQLLSQPADGRIKLLVISRALQHRRRRRDLFDRGGYIPLTVEGTRARNIFAFARTLEGTASLTVVGRLLASVAPPGVAPVGEASWSDTRLVLPTTLPQRAYRDALTGTIIELDRGPSGPGLRLSQALGHLPVAILEPS
jgi:(1->4)-alpha-D-glucan 1-alpha-D-glucosylmutase